MTHTCPHCGQRMTLRHGVRLSPREADLFDLIDNDQDRIERIAQIVNDLCQQDLASFLKECYNRCKYNQQHLAEMRSKVRNDFPERFFQFLKQYHADE